MYQLTCSIVLYNNKYAAVKKAIDSVLKTNLKTKLFLVDNSETDALKSLAYNSGIEYIFNNRNLGYGAGHNVALLKAINNSFYHLVLNPDVEFEAGVLESIYNYAENNKEVGHIMPKVLNTDGTVQYTCKLLPTPFNLISRLLPASLFKKYNEKFELHFSNYNVIMEVPYLSGCFMFLRCAALKEVGLFDERFFMYPEDIDLTRRMHKQFKTIFYPHVHITHEHAKSSFKNLKLFKVHIANMIRYFNKWGWIFDSERKRVNKQILQQFEVKQK